MASEGSPHFNQISFKGELVRKATHMFALVIPGGYYFLGLSRAEALFIMVPITFLMFMIDISRFRDGLLWKAFSRKFVLIMIREHESAGDFTGAAYILMSSCFAIAFYEKPVAVAALAFIIVGDTLAALIGRKFGRHKFGNKSVEGSLGCLAGTILVALAAPGLALTVGLLGAVTATVVEALSTRIDDNVTVPVISGLVMSIFIRILSAF
ncbi:MAG: diacylglycerol/polyprenol kinase family protein [Candidatus Zixiibacteriota bacterium]